MAIVLGKEIYVLRFDLTSPERVSVGEEGEGHSVSIDKARVASSFRAVLFLLKGLNVHRNLIMVYQGWGLGGGGGWGEGRVPM